MAVAAAAQAFAPNLWSLIAIRFVLGIGVGADYVLSPTIMAEHANARIAARSSRFGFGAMWGFGAIFAALVLSARAARRPRRSAVADRARLRRRARTVGADAAPPHAGDRPVSRARRGQHRQGEARCSRASPARRSRPHRSPTTRVARAVREARARRARRCAAVDDLRHRPLLRRAVRTVGDRRAACT